MTCFRLNYKLTNTCDSNTSPASSIINISGLISFSIWFLSEHPTVVANIISVSNNGY